MWLPILGTAHYLTLLQIHLTKAHVITQKKKKKYRNSIILKDTENFKKSIINWTRKYETPLLTTNRITTAGSVYQNCIGATEGSWLRRWWKALFSHSLVVTSTQFAVGLPDFTRLKHPYRNICKSTLRSNTNTLKLFELNCWLQNVSHNSSIPVEICSFYLQV